MSARPLDPTRPLPRLPPELVSMVFEHVKDEDDDELRITTGNNIALAWRGWIQHGRRVVWDRVTLYCDGSDAVAPQLADRPWLASEIRDLSIYRGHNDDVSGDGADVPSDVFSAAIEIAFKVLDLCSSHLERLNLCQTDLDCKLLVQVANLSPASTLRKLYIFATVGPWCTLAEIASALKHFINLSFLFLDVQSDGHEGSDQIEPAGLPMLPVETLQLGLAVVEPGAGQMLALLWDPDRLRLVTLEVANGAKAEDLAWLLALPKLKEIALGTVRPADFPAAFPVFVNLLEQLSGVEHIEMCAQLCIVDKDNDEANNKPSPVPIEVVFRSFPLKMKSSMATGVYFEDRMHLLSTEAVNEVPGGPCVDVTLAQDVDGKQVRWYCTVVRDMLPNGSQQWAIREKVRDVHLSSLKSALADSLSTWSTRRSSSRTARTR